jgi:hypothetical protein
MRRHSYTGMQDCIMSIQTQAASRDLEDVRVRHRRDLESGMGRTGGAEAVDARVALAWEASWRLSTWRRRGARRNG